MNKFSNEELVGKFNVLESYENNTKIVTALKGFEEETPGGEYVEALKEVNMTVCFENRELVLSYTVGDFTQSKRYNVPENCTCLKTVSCGLTEDEVLDIDFETNNEDKAFLHLRYGEDLQIDNEIIELIGEDEECEVFPDAEGYWCLEDLLELE